MVPVSEEGCRYFTSKYKSLRTQSRACRKHGAEVGWRLAAAAVTGAGNTHQKLFPSSREHKPSCTRVASDDRLFAPSAFSAL